MKHEEQSGRTLLEMLSVLAIIGVLTLVSLYAYKYALTHYRANETVDEVNRWAASIGPQLVAAEARGEEEEFDISELSAETHLGYKIDAALSVKPGYFEVMVYALPVKVCEKILGLGFVTPSAIDVVGWENAADNGKCGEGETADMIFEFRKDFDPNAGSV